MAKYYILLLIFLLSKINFNNCIVSEEKLSLIESLNKELNIKHCTIIKDLEFIVDNKILNLVKKFSFNKIFSSFLTADEMENLMNKLYTYPSQFPQIGEYQEQYFKIIEKRKNQAYPPKTLVIFYGESLEKTLIRLFRVSKLLKCDFYFFVAQFLISTNKFLV